jgi:hypothetical protein
MRLICYPTSYIREPLASALVLYLEGFSLCLAGGMDVNPRLSPYVEKGIVTPLRTGRPFPPDIHRLLQEYVLWGSEHFGETQTLKAQKVLADWEKKESLPAIVHNIRKTIHEASSAPNALEWRPHLLLHLAQKLEEDNEALENLMAQVKKAGDSLSASLGVEKALPPRDHLDIPPFSFQEADFLIPELVRAWAYLFGEQLSEDAVLMTTHEPVHYYLIEQCEMLKPNPTGEVSGTSIPRTNETFTVGPLALPAPSSTDAMKILEVRNTWAEPIRRKLYTALLSLTEVLRNEALVDAKEPIEALFTYIKETVEVAGRLPNAPEDMSRVLFLTLTSMTGVSVHEVLKAVSEGKKGGDAPSFIKGSGCLLISAQMA